MRIFWLMASGVACSLAAVSGLGCASRAPAVATPASAGSGALSTRSGASDGAGKMCGGIAGLRCDAGQYCAFPPSAHCCATDMAGKCKAIPDLCSMELAPVCGCDNKTYATACLASRSGVSVASNGACPGDSDSALADGALCGTRGIVEQCAQGSYCAYKSQCGTGDAGGTCTKKPETCPNVYVGVCGCDGRAYPNACQAEREGVSVASSGACKP